MEIPYPYVEYQKALQDAGEKLLGSCAAKARKTGIDVDSKLITIEMFRERIYDAIEEQ
jgi:hypothetical protein